MAPATRCIFDPPYKDCDVRAYTDKTLNHEEMLDILIHAKFYWVLSEYEHPIYEVLGEPVRIKVNKDVSIARDKREKAVECLWTNFPVLQSPAMDKNQIIAELKAEIARLQGAVLSLEGGSTPAHTSKALQRAAAPKPKGRSWSPEKRAEMSRKLKAAWAKRKKKS